MTMELRVWPSDFGLPSIDPECLQFIVCAKMCASPVTIVPSTTPWQSPNGEYPVLLDSDKTSPPITEFDKFVELLRKTGEVTLDGDLTPTEKCALDACACLVQNKLLPAILYAQWLDDLNYTTVTHFWYSSRLYFPFSLYYVEKRRKRVERFLNGRNVNDVLKDALSTINLLALKLGDNKYLCGNKPTSLDALVVGLMAPLLRLPFPNDRLQLHLIGCSNLVRYVEATISIYLPVSQEELLQQKASKRVWALRMARAEKEKKARAEKREEEVEDLPMRDSILFAVGAVTLSLLFAVHTGILSVSVEQELVE